MKAWIVDNIRISEDFCWNEIVFADNYKEAKKLALETDLYEYPDDFVNIRVKRYPNMDDTENLNHKDYTYKLWQSGWMWVGECPLDPYDNYSDKQEACQDFLEWYNEYYGSEKNENH